VRQRRQPLGDRGGIVDDDVVGAAPAPFDRGDGRVGGVGDVDERPHAATVADHREAVLADELELLLAGRQRRARPVEDAVAQHDPLGPRTTGTAPISSSASRFDGLRVIPWTSCPAATNRGTSCRPIAPVAPATNTLMSHLLDVDHIHPRRRDEPHMCDIAAGRRRGPRALGDALTAPA
jgi:hypothetical protein